MHLGYSDLQGFPYTDLRTPLAMLDLPANNVENLRYFTPPKRRFGKTEQQVGCVCSRYCAMGRRPNRVLTPRKVPRKYTPHTLFRFPESSLGGAWTCDRRVHRYCMSTSLIFPTRAVYCPIVTARERNPHL